MKAKLFHEPAELKMVTTKAIKKGEQIVCSHALSYGSELSAEI